MPRSKGRCGRPWRRAAAQVRAQVRDHNTPCCICGHPIDLTLHYLHRLAFTVEHRQALNAGGALRDPSNLAPAHRSCNSRKGDRATALPRTTGATSRQW